MLKRLREQHQHDVFALDKSIHIVWEKVGSNLQWNAKKSDITKCRANLTIYVMKLSVDITNSSLFKQKFLSLTCVHFKSKFHTHCYYIKFFLPSIFDNIVASILQGKSSLMWSGALIM